MLGAAYKANYQNHFNHKNPRDMLLFAHCRVSLPSTSHVYSMSNVLWNQSMLNSLTIHAM